MKFSVLYKPKGQKGTLKRGTT